MSEVGRYIWVICKRVTLIKPDGKSLQPWKNKGFHDANSDNHRRYRLSSLKGYRFLNPKIEQSAYHRVALIKSDVDTPSAIDFTGASAISTAPGDGT